MFQGLAYMQVRAVLLYVENVSLTSRVMRACAPGLFLGGVRTNTGQAQAKQQQQTITTTTHKKIITSQTSFLECIVNASTWFLSQQPCQTLYNRVCASRSWKHV